jgi:alpha-L-rhamnosidase
MYPDAFLSAARFACRAERTESDVPDEFKPLMPVCHSSKGGRIRPLRFVSDNQKGGRLKCKSSLVTLGFACALIGYPARAENLQPFALKCEYQTNPLGIGRVSPSLSWKLESSQRGQKQAAYRVLVASDPDGLAHDTGDLWDSGKISSDRSIHVIYAGQTLLSRQLVFWKVAVWDNSGQLSSWSDPAYWSVGLLQPEDWKGEWISAQYPAVDSGPTRAVDAAILLRKAVKLEFQPARATAYISGLGYYELYLNGHKLGSRVLDPGFTDYTKRVLYSTYDATEDLTQGQNSVAVMLGGGWYHLATPDAFGLEQAPWTAPPKLLLNIDIEFADGSRQTIATDLSWKWSTGPILFNCVRGGETYDARLEKPGWNMPSLAMMIRPGLQ